MSRSYFRFFVALFLSVFASSCVTNSVSNSGSHTKHVWSAYLTESPFSYEYDSDGPMVAMLNQRLRSISLEGADPLVARHVNAVIEWTATYPQFRARAIEAKNDAYAKAKGYSAMSRECGKWFGATMADDDNKPVGGALGSLFGWLANDLYSSHAGERAAAEVMRPCARRGFLLAEAEHAINYRLGYASTNHLRRILGRY